MSTETLAYQTDRPQLHYDPDGTLHIDVPPSGWRKALNVRSTKTLVIGALL
jgi:hypothetical protein